MSSAGATCAVLDRHPSTHVSCGHDLIAMRCIAVAAAFASVPQRSSGPRTAPAAACRPAIIGGLAPLLRWAALLVQACGGQTDPETPSRTLPPTTEPERPPTPPDTTPTPDSEPHRSTARNATRMTRGYNPQRPTVPLVEHPTGPGGSTAAWAWAACSGQTARALSGSSSLAKVDTVPRRDHPARAAPLGRRPRWS